MRHLVDADLASNNGGRQWSASTGADAVPYFRLFNRWTEGRRFDSDGSFIQRYVPELADLDASLMHDRRRLAATDPERYGCRQPIVRHQTAPVRALDACKVARE